MKRILVSMFLLIALAAVPLFGQPDNRNCTQVGGALITNIGAIDGVYNLGPVWGDLRGAVAAKIISANPDGTYTVKHTWIAETGDVLDLSLSILKPAYPLPNDPAVVAVPWGHYSSEIKGGTGKFENAKGHLDYVGMADFTKNTLVLRYKGYVCYAKSLPARDDD